MNLKNVYFKNGMSHGQLKVQSEKIASYATRDLLQLQALGLTAELIADLRAKAQKLETTQSYGQTVSPRKELTTSRNDCIIEVTGSIEVLRSQLKLTFLEKSSKNYATLTKAMSKLNVDEFIQLALDTLNVLKRDISEFTIYGITPELIENFESQVKNLIEVNNNQIEVDGALVNETMQRSEERKEVAYLLDYISGLGRAYWKRKNPAMSKNYVIIRQKRASKLENDDADDDF